MSRHIDWRNYVDANGDFELANYLYHCFNDLMKSSLDMGTLLSEDKAKLRAFKEQTKTVFKNRWLEVAQVFESFDILVPCGCEHNEYCTVCGGSRYQLNQALNPDKVREVAFVYGVDQTDDLKDKLMKGLEQAIDDYNNIKGKEIYGRPDLSGAE